MKGGGPLKQGGWGAGGKMMQESKYLKVEPDGSVTLNVTSSRKPVS